MVRECCHIDLPHNLPIRFWLCEYQSRKHHSGWSRYLHHPPSMAWVETLPMKDCQVHSCPWQPSPWRCTLAVTFWMWWRRILVLKAQNSCKSFVVSGRKNIVSNSFRHLSYIYCKQWRSSNTLWHPWCRRWYPSIAANTYIANFIFLQHIASMSSQPHSYSN